MKERMPPPNWLRSFEAAARTGSFTAAAEELGLSPAAVSHQIRALEHRLGFALFERLPRSVELTTMGSAYLPSIRKAFDEMAAATAGLFGPVGKRTVTVRAPVSFSILCLTPRLPEFTALYPKIDIRVCSAIWADALTLESTDIDIRFGHGQWQGLSARRLSESPCVPVTAPNVSAPMQTLAAGPLIHVMGSEDVWVRVLREIAPAEVTPASASPRPSSRGFKVDTSLAAAELAASGAGTAMLLRSFAAPYVAQGRLATPNGYELAMAEAHYVVERDSDHHARPETLLFRDWLFDVFAGDRG